MSPAKRRRRRRGRGGGGGGSAGGDPKGARREQPRREQAPPPQPTARRRRRRGRGRGAAREAASPKSSEDLVRALPGEKLTVATTAPPDGTKLEDVIGDLQSQWGVPQYPQEYRLTVKVNEEREARAERVTPTSDSAPKPVPQTSSNGPRRERAPAAPRIDRGGDGSPSPRRRRRGRRRRRRGGEGGSSPSAGP